MMQATTKDTMRATMRTTMKGMKRNTARTTVTTTTTTKATFHQLEVEEGAAAVATAEDEASPEACLTRLDEACLLMLVLKE
jgi:hypothetical protein